MDTLPRREGSAIERRYGVAQRTSGSACWRTFCWASFALIVLLVPDRDSAKLCRAELGRFVVESGKRFVTLQAPTPESLEQLPAQLLEVKANIDTGAIWCAAVSTRSAADFVRWEAAWRHALAALNQQRNPLRRKLDCPLVLVRAHWIVPLFLEIAPDLWSVRTQVVHVEPARDRAGSVSVDDRQPSVPEPDRPRSRGGSRPRACVERG